MSASAPSFSPSLTLAGMDYIAPSAACIKPTLIRNAATAGGAEDGLVELRRGGNAVAPLFGAARDSRLHPEVVKITLQDCLACSGCVTTAETVLVNAQSRAEIISTLLEHSPRSTEPSPNAAAATRGRLVSISPQSCASLAAYLHQSMEDTYALLAGFFRTVLTPAGLRASAAAAAAAAAPAAAIATDPTTRAAHASSVELHGAEGGSEASAQDPVTYVIDLEWAEQLSAALTAQEYTRRRDESPATLPMIVSACPGWVCYCEKQGSALLPHLCPVMSAQGIAGSYAKRTVATDLYHISIQPCFDRKLEAARDAMPGGTLSLAPQGMEETTENVFYTDCVLSTAELLEWMREVDPSLPWRDSLDSRVRFPEAHPAVAATSTSVTTARFHASDGEGEGYEAEQPLEKEHHQAVSETASGGAGANAPASTSAVSAAAAHDAARLAGSGGYHQCVIADRLRRQRGIATASPLADVKYEVKRNRNHQLATCAALPGEVFCVGYGFQQIQNVVRGLKKKTPAMRSYTFVELMACPDGCLNGGGQVRPAQQPHSEVLDAVIDAYAHHTCPEKAAQPRRLEVVPAAASPSDWMKRHPFADSTVAAMAPSLGEELWRCTFRDREKEFAEMLDAGNIHSLKW